MIASDLLDLYPCPDPSVSEDQFNKFEHGDLAALTNHDLRRELVALRLINFVVDSEWHRERELQVLGELQHRGDQ